MNTLISIPHGACLIEALIADLISRPAVELQRTLILMPTRRLQLQIAAHLATKAGGAAWLPKMATWDQFIQSESAAFNQDQIPLATTPAELALAQVIKELGNKVPEISEGHAHELLHFLKELWRHGKRSTGIAPLTEWLGRQWYLDPAAGEQIIARAERIYLVLDEFESRLHQEGYALQEEIDAFAIRSWRDTLAEGIWNPISQSERIIVAGLTSLTECQQQLLQDLSKVEHLEVWTDTPWQTLPLEAPLRRIRAALGGPLKSPDEPMPQQFVTHLQAVRDPFCEAATALERAEHAIKQGFPPQRVAILIPDEPQYASSFAALSDQLALRRNIPLSRPWSTTQAGAWMTMLQRWTNQRDSVAFAALLLNYHSHALLFENTTSAEIREAFATQVSDWLKDAPQTIDSLGIFELSLAHLPSTPELSALWRRGWSVFQGSRSLSLAAQEQHWQSFFAPFIESLSEKDIDLVEKLAWQSLNTAESEVRLLPRTLTVYAQHWSGYINAVIKLAQNTTLRETGEPLTNLQIISITEARYVPLDVAIIVGCVEGIFPHRVPRDTLVDHTLKSALNLPGWRQLEALEDSTFGLLVSRIPHVELLWPESIGETGTVKSRWVEKIHAAGQPIVRQESQVLKQLFASSAQPTPSATQSLEGKVPDRDALIRQISASSLRALMACPYQFLLKQRGIRSFRRREVDDPILIGNLLHKVIEVCLKPQRAFELQLPKASLWRKDFAHSSDVESWAFIRLKSLSRLIIPPSMQDNPEILQITEKSWRQLAKDWSTLFEIGMNPAEALVEERFTQERPVYIPLGERQIAVTGAIDVIHHNPKTRDWMICDYKTGRVPEVSAVKNGYEPQLILYSMCLTSTAGGFKPEHGVISYRSLKSGELSTISVGQDVLTTWSSPFGPCKLDLSALIADFTSRWLKRIESVEKHDRFFAETHQCGYCDFADICRKNDPRYRDQIRDQEAF